MISPERADPDSLFAHMSKGERRYIWDLLWHVPRIPILNRPLVDRYGRPVEIYRR